MSDGDLPAEALRAGSVRARAPASTANLGPGFDTLAVALSLYLDVEVEPAVEFALHTEGEGAQLPADRSHLAARVAIDVAGHDRLSITVRSQIPVARGLGSSAALTAATALAAGAEDPLDVTSAFEGHADNAAAAVMGGLVSATDVGGRPTAVRLPLDPELRFVVLVPESGLSTGEAREVLPEVIPRADASFNLGRMGMLLAGLGDHRLLRREATDDRLHQAARQALFPESAVLMAGLLDAGALATCWSGAGPSVVGFCLKSMGDDLRQAGKALMSNTGIDGRVLVLEPDHVGLIQFAS